MRCFSTIVCESEVLSKENHAVIRLLHKQNMCRILIPRLLKLYDDDGGVHSIPAVCCLLQNMPKQLLGKNLEEVGFLKTI